MRHSTENRARKAQTLDSRVERMRTQAVSGPAKERRYLMRFPPPPHAGRVVLEVDNLTKSYGGPPVFAKVDFAVEKGERLLIMGLNGAGKTSLLRILAGQTTPDTGTLTFGHGVSAGYYAQEHEGIKAGVDVMTHMREMAEPGTTEQGIRNLLGMMGLSGEIAFQDASTLSGGEKTKLSLAQLVAGRHNLLLLDEPTNNLDPPSRDAVAAALGSWPGAMVIVSHDAGFVESLGPERVLLMPDGDLDYWSDDLLELVSLA
jgi:ATPase subunit of ABC transporter with duplicated ATPase domains